MHAPANQWTSTGTPHVITSKVVALRAIEVNQAIQGWENSVPLVQTKRSIVRCNCRPASPIQCRWKAHDCAGSATARELRTLSGQSGGVSPINRGGAITVSNQNFVEEWPFSTKLPTKFPTKFQKWRLGQAQLRFHDGAVEAP